MSLEDFNTDTWVAVAAAAIAAGSALASIVSSRKSHRHAEDANRHSSTALQLQAKTWADEYFQNVRQWGDETVNILARAVHLCDLPSESDAGAHRLEIRAQLSALMDRGRWYFPNKFEKKVGLRKEPAYRGIRQRVIEELGQAYEALSSAPLSRNRELRSRLVKHQRVFVSEIQLVLDPRKREQELAHVLEMFDLSKRDRQPGNGQS